MAEFERDGVRLVYEERGRRDGTPVVLLHGFTSDRRSWYAVAEQLQRRFRVVMPDLRGHGESDAPEGIESYTMADYAADVGALLDAIGVERCHLAGSSFGGMVAMQFAVDSPQRVETLTLSDTSPAYDRPEYDDGFREREAGIAQMVDSMARFGPRETGRRMALRASDAYIADGIRRRYAGLNRAGVVGAAKARRERPDLTERLRTLPMPVLLCMGRDDAVYCALDLMRRELPGARAVTFEDVGHGVPARSPRKFADTLLAFLDDVKAGKPVAAEVAL